METSALTQSLGLSVYFNDGDTGCRKYMVRDGASGAVLYQGREVAPPGWQQAKSILGRYFRAAFNLSIQDAAGRVVAHASSPGWQSNRIHVRLRGGDDRDWGHVHLRFLGRQHMVQTLQDAQEGLYLAPVILSRHNRLFRKGELIGDLVIPVTGNGPGWAGQIDHFKLSLLPEVKGDDLLEVLAFLACPLMLDCMRRNRI